MQMNLFDKQVSPIQGNTVLWDGKRMPLDEAIKWAKLQVRLAPSFPKYRETLDFLLQAKGTPHA
jgi:hypothetical protein